MSIVRRIHIHICHWSRMDILDRCDEDLEYRIMNAIVWNIGSVSHYSMINRLKDGIPVLL